MTLPTIGPKSAARLAFHILHASPSKAEELSAALLEVKEKIRDCDICGNLTDSENCSICRSPKRDRTVICVVGDPREVAAIERTHEFRGLYHVLGGLISPIDGRGPEHLRLDSLETRLGSGEVEELILATNPTVAGEATALYLQKQMQRDGLRITRLALGLPVGSDLEYTDELTLGRALQGRREV